MKLEISPQGWIVTVTLSRRNLLALLDKVDNSLSARTLVKHEKDGHQLIVRAQPDAEHYKDRPPPGPMSDRSEGFIRAHTNPNSSGSLARLGLTAKEIREGAV